ncbi:sialate O-acetylesterase [uncultured Fibrobacter sp.]|uniref:sialate O-acetylesterase n=1 Tax=uncultured Fibrobacter sp. TaxID=261512 RepID=UPI0025FE1905|nr:sialate O-acetylesterase [uncultured Fibrobacter sp.]
MYRSLLPAFVVAATVSLSFAQDPNLHIYLAYGQSNMSGQADVTAADRAEDPRFLVLRAANHSNQKVGEFYPAAPPMGHSASKVGIVDIFGRKMVKELPDSIKIAVANIAIGGQSIDLFDKDRNKTYVQNAKNKGDTWWIQYLDEYGGDLYKRIVEMGKIAKEKGVIKGFLFHQGEADYQMNDWPKRVKKVYDDLIKDLGLDSTKVPILVGELATTAAGGDLGWRNSAVAEAASLIPNGHLISAEGCPALKEPSYTLHFTRQGYETFGERYAEKMLELLKKAEPEVPPVDTSAKDTAVAVADSSVKDSSVSVADTSKVAADTSKVVADTSTTAIHNSKSTELAIRYSSKNNGHLIYDEKRHKVFISVEKNGRKWLIDVTGGRNR